MRSLRSVPMVLVVSLIFAAGCGKKTPGNKPDGLTFEEARSSVMKQAAAAQGHGGEGAAALEIPPEVPDFDIQSIPDGNNSFSLDFFHRQGQGKKGANLFCSPFSVYTALLMAYAGAEKTTKDEMRSVLHVVLEGEKLHKGFAYFWWLMKKKRNELVAANRIWTQTGLPVSNLFVNINRKYYGSSAERLDLMGDPAGSAKKINAWAAETTKDRIRDVVSAGDITPLTKLIITNAVYFNGTWDSKFKKEETKEEPFFLADGSSVKVPLMSQLGDFNYAEQPGLQVLEMPYLENELSMWVFLPTAPDGKEAGNVDYGKLLESVETSLTAESFAAIRAKATSTLAMVFFPRFRIDSMLRAGDTLKSMGMESALDPAAADFSGFFRAGEKPGQFFLSDVVQKAFVDVNEEGTVAGAVTVVFNASASSEPPKPVVFRADHPFVFLIMDNATKSILFIGRLASPTAS